MYRLCSVRVGNNICEEWAFHDETFRNGRKTMKGMPCIIYFPMMYLHRMHSAISETKLGAQNKFRISKLDIHPLNPKITFFSNSIAFSWRMYLYSTRLFQQVLLTWLFPSVVQRRLRINSAHSIQHFKFKKLSVEGVVKWFLTFSFTAVSLSSSDMVVKVV